MTDQNEQEVTILSPSEAREWLDEFLKEQQESN